MSDNTRGAPSRSAPASTVTVVVPTRNAQRTLGACLRSIRNQNYPCRTVVVDNGSTDGTVTIAEHGADVVLHAGPERSAQRNIGARALPADIVGFIDADMILDLTVVEEAVAGFHNGAGSVIVPERTIGRGFWVGVRAFERSFYDGSDAIEAARFFRWDIFERTGGFDEQLTGPEDWDLSESARQLAPVARTVAGIQHDEGAIGYLAACRKKAYYAEGLQRYVAKRGITALRQAGFRPWLRQPRRLMNRQGVGLVTLKAGESLAIMTTLFTKAAFRMTRHPKLNHLDRRVTLRTRWDSSAPSRIALFDRIRRRNGKLVFDRDLQERLASYPDHRTPWIDDLVGGLRGKDVIDIGCWTVALLRDMQTLDPRECVGVDLPGPWIDMAKQNAPNARIVTVQSLASMPKQLPQRFDTAICLETLEHLPSRTETSALNSIRTLLRDRGTLVLSTPAAGLAALLDPAWYLTGHRHYSARNLRQLLSATGFTVTAVYYSGDILSWIDLMRHYASKYLPGVPEPNSTTSPRATQTDRSLRVRTGLLPQSIWVVAEASTPRIPFVNSCPKESL